MTKNSKKLQLEKINIFFFKNCNFLIPRHRQRMSKLQEKPSALKKAQPALQNMKFLSLFSIFVGNVCPPWSGYGSAFSTLIWIQRTKSNVDPDPQHWQINSLVKTKDDLLVGLFRHGSVKAEYCIVPW
jgi:hypothetical protein